MDVLEIVKNLIKIPSVTDYANESVPLLLIKKLLEAEGKNIKIKQIGKGSKKNLIARIGRGRNAVLLNGHFDVVPGPTKLFNPIIQGEKLYGRGSADSKGPLACLLKAFIGLSYEKLNSEIILVCVCDEENAGERGSKKIRDEGIMGDYNIIAEPTNLLPIMGEKGFIRIKVISRGKSAHAAFPENGLNAIEQMNLVPKILQNAFKADDNFLGKSTVSQNIIIGGGKINIVPNECEACFDIRFLPSQEPRKLIEKAKQKLAKLGKFGIKILSRGAPVNFDQASKLNLIVSKLLNQKPCGIAFATDARFFAERDCLIFGPGNPELSHQDNENVKIKDLYKAVEIYKSFVLKLIDSDE